MAKGKERGEINSLDDALRQLAQKEISLPSERVLKPRTALRLDMELGMEEVGFSQQGIEGMSGMAIDMETGEMIFDRLIVDEILSEIEAEFISEYEANRIRTDSKSRFYDFFRDATDEHLKEIYQTLVSERTDDELKYSLAGESEKVRESIRTLAKRESVKRAIEETKTRLPVQFWGKGGKDKGKELDLQVVAAQVEIFDEDGIPTGMTEHRLLIGSKEDPISELTMKKQLQDNQFTIGGENPVVFDTRTNSYIIQIRDAKDGTIPVFTSMQVFMHEKVDLYTQLNELEQGMRGEDEEEELLPGMPVKRKYTPVAAPGVSSIPSYQRPTTWVAARSG